MTYTDWVKLCRNKFPALTDVNSRPTSDADDGYNCIAWAAEDIERWWWPDAQEQQYWPLGVPRVETVEAFSKAFELLGYSKRSDNSLEIGRRKVAIFASAQGKPTHAARQLPDGWWASKLGPQIDIEHQLHAIEGPEYGSVILVLAHDGAPFG